MQQILISWKRSLQTFLDNSEAAQTGIAVRSDTAFPQSFNKQLVPIKQQGKVSVREQEAQDTLLSWDLIAGIVGWDNI